MIDNTYTITPPSIYYDHEHDNYYKFIHKVIPYLIGIHQTI